MVKKLDLPGNENELRQTTDLLFIKAKSAIEKNKHPNFNGLLELMSCEVTILTAIHNIKSNKGSQTPGIDGETMDLDILQKEYGEIIKRVQDSFQNYKPLPILRKYIPKANKKELRPLGIPVIIERIIQECIRIIIDPILEAQFFMHSYGFRPMRSTQQALERVNTIIFKCGYYWVIEGDISKYFDTVNHNILLHKLWNMGIKDKRVLMIIKQMLKAGIMNEIQVNELGTPQGGVISPTLGNVYLHCFDKMTSREWEEKQTKVEYSVHYAKIRSLKETNLCPAYLIRYCDDWVVVTNSKANAERWKMKIEKYLRTELKLTLSSEKTVITCVKEKPIHFLGYELKAYPGKSRTGYIVRSWPNKDRLKLKILKLKERIKSIRSAASIGHVVSEIGIVNAMIRGLIQYHEATTLVNIVFAKYADEVNSMAYHALVRFGGKMIPANQVNNLRLVHRNYTKQIPYIVYHDSKVGITSLHFCKWKMVKRKNQKETPYTQEGRELHVLKTGRKMLIARADDLLNLNSSDISQIGYNNPLYNFEYYLNSAYAFNRDKCKCRVCGKLLETSIEIHTHHAKPYLPINKVNKVGNLVTVDKGCHEMVHSSTDYSYMSKKIWERIVKFRDKMINSVK